VTLQTVTIADIAAPDKRSIAIGPFGSSLKADLYVPSGVPVVRGQNIKDGGEIDESDLVFVEPETAARFPACLVNEGDLVFPHRGAIGRVGIVGKRQMLLSSSMMKLTVDPLKVDSRFVFYYFRGPGQHELLMRASTVGTPGIGQPLTSLRGISIQIPRLDQQRAIAEVLGALDDKIASNTKLAATAEKLISVHFQRAIESEGTTSRSLFETFHIDFGEPFRGADFSDPGVGRPLIRIRDLKTFTSQVWTTESRSREILIQPGDVVVGMDAEFRPTSWLGEPGLLNQRVCRARGRSTGPAFVREALRNPLRRIENYKAATTVIHLNKKDLEEAEVLVPASESLALFEKAVEALYSQRVSIAMENRSLGSTRDALLPQLMSGKLRVKDAEKVLEDAGV
jgi:type I restriction enzyme S subunit